MSPQVCVVLKTVKKNLTKTKHTVQRMGNDASSTVNWSELSKSGQKCEISNAKDILTRLNINFAGSDNQDDDKKDDNADNNDSEKYLDEYLEKSDEDLKKLFLRFGVNPDFDDKATKKEN